MIRATLANGAMLQERERRGRVGLEALTDSASRGFKSAAEATNSSCRRCCWRLLQERGSNKWTPLCPTFCPGLSGKVPCVVRQSGTYLSWAISKLDSRGSGPRAWTLMSMLCMQIAHQHLHARGGSQCYGRVRARLLLDQLLVPDCATCFRNLYLQTPYCSMSPTCWLCF